MRTLLSRFSEDFVRSLDPLLAPLDDTAAGFAGASDNFPGRDSHTLLRDTHHHLQVLVNKVADQHAFVLIFGPLKSGKSTMMNALSAAYVSEVTSLPAYPCMVHVSHSKTRSFTIARYDGDTEVVTDTAALHMIVQRAHNELADALRRIEESGEEFDPATHYPQAIRKIDVRMPAGALEHSGAELVDTPGLYSRMKFGYDRMTRDFRDVAACAIFVVKSDNLFLEQVFEEFKDLLDLFSRIFLVVNVDSTKMDLGPQGELVPSLEQEEPLRIVEAFENYAMSAPLKKAAEEGRLRIYPIDLLQAASRRLREAAAPQLGPANGFLAEEDGAQEPDVSDVIGEDVDFHGQSSFQNFQDDLAQFLNSADYLTAFIQDSLRRADSLLGELSDVLGLAAVRRLGMRLDELRRAKAQAERCSVAVEQLSKFGWEAAFDDFEQKLNSLVRERVRVASEKTSDGLDRALEAWFKTDASAQDLIEHELKPLLSDHQAELASFVEQTLMREASGVAGGIRVSPDVTEQLRLADVRADELARAAIESIRTTVQPMEVGAPFQTADVPVRKAFWDWCMFRTQGSMRRRLFGPPATPSVRVTKGDKATRLGASAKTAMKRAIDRYKGEFFPAAADRVRQSVLTEYAAAMSRSLRSEVSAKQEELATRSAVLEKELLEHADVHGRLTALEGELDKAQAAVEDLHHVHGDAVPDLVLDPMAPAPEGFESTDDGDPDASSEPIDAPLTERGTE